MSKELEIMKEERERLVQEDYADICIEECDLVIKALQRLEAIDNANPSEALNGLFDLVTCQGSFEKAQKYFDIIEQALLKAQQPKQYVDELKLVEKKLKALDLLMQELDCKDFADLRKYARCGYEKLNNK